MTYGTCYKPRSSAIMVENLQRGLGHSHLWFQEAGKKALQDKRFEPAKHAFDQALFQASRLPNSDASILIEILDLRIEAHLKLKNLEAAVKDARNMVRHDRADPRGYLRCGQLSRLKSDSGKAKMWYEQGLKNVSQSHAGYQTLRSMITRTTGKSTISQDKLQDPLMVLPMDLIHMVFYYLHLWEATSCLRVSKTWRNTLLATHSLWKSLDLSGTRRNITLRYAKACVRRLPTPPTTVRLDQLTVAAATYLRPYIQRWTALEHLSIDDSRLSNADSPWSVYGRMKTLHIGRRCPIYFDVVDEILHCCNTLQKAFFDGLLPRANRRERFYGKVNSQRPLHHHTTLPQLSHLGLTSELKGDGRSPLIAPVSQFSW
jgi:tetratricopeptide (TPR) repeat protein